MEQRTDWREVEAIVERAEGGGGTVGVTVIGPDGDAFRHKGERRFGAASTVKIPIMIEMYRQIDRGERLLTDRYALRNEDRAVGSGVLLHLHEAIELTLNDLVYLMISISDNTATNVLIDLVGMDNV